MKIVNMQAVEPVDNGMNFTPAGHLTIIANALRKMQDRILEVRSSLLELGTQTLRKEKTVDNILIPAYEVNAQAYLIVVSLQSLLDSLAAASVFALSWTADTTAVQFFEPVTETSKIYFSDHEFSETCFQWIRAHQRVIAGIKFNSLPFKDIANNLKHKHPYIQPVSMSGRDELFDIFDRDGNGLLRNVILPVFDEAKAICGRLMGQEEFCRNGIQPTMPSFLRQI